MSTANELPLSAEDLVRRGVDSGSGDVPAELLSPEGAHSVTVAVAEEGAEAEIRSAEALDGGLIRVRLNGVVAGGVPGAGADRIATAELEKFGGEDTEPGRRPPWADLAYLPRPSVPHADQPLRRFRGGSVIPSQDCVAHIIDAENRTEYWPSGYPWHCIGKLFVWSNAANPSWDWVATGELVGRNVVLTASHVFPWSSGNWAIRFVPAFYNDGSILGASVASWVETARGYREHAQGNDMVVLKLSDPLGDSLGWFGTRTYNDDWEGDNVWTFCGYPCDRAMAKRPYYQAGIPVVDDDSEGDALEIEHRGDEAKGMSGGPLFGTWDDGPYVIGTHSGWEDEFGSPAHSVAAGGKALTNLVRWAGQNWP